LRDEWLLLPIFCGLVYYWVLVDLNKSVQHARDWGKSVTFALLQAAEH